MALFEFFDDYVRRNLRTSAPLPKQKGIDRYKRGHDYYDNDPMGLSDEAVYTQRTGKRIPPVEHGDPMGLMTDKYNPNKVPDQTPKPKKVPAVDAGDANNGGGSLPEKQPKTGSGGSETRVIPGSGGATQTGKNLGKVNLPELDMTGMREFAGPSFPTQPGTNKITDGYKNTGGANGYGLADNEVDSGRFTVIGGKKYAISQEAVQDQKDYGFKGPSMPASDGEIDSNDRFNGNMDVNGLDDNDFGGPDPADYASSGEEMRRRAAFLGDGGSMEGIKAVNAGMNMKYAGGKYYGLVDGETVELDSDRVRAIRNAAPGKAQALKDEYVQIIRNKVNETTDTPSAEQNPLTKSSIAAFKGNSPLGNTRYGEELPGAPSLREFNNNNSQDTPGFGLSLEDEDRDPNKFDLRKNFYI